VRRELMSRAGTDVRGPEAGFTLVEALFAIVILVFGLMAVTNLMLVAGTSTNVANQSTLATVAASQVLDGLKATTWEGLVPGGDINSDIPLGPPAPDCTAAVTAPGVYNCNSSLPGVGIAHVRWALTVAGPRTLYIQVRAEGTGALAVARSRAEFTTFRVCTDSTPADNLPANPACPVAPGCPVIGCGG
jgi:type II secretory pathway pseudopilin PulG